MYAILLYKIELVVLVFLETSQPHTMNNFRVGDFHGNFAFMISSPDCELTDSGYILMISWGSVSQSFNNKFKRYILHNGYFTELHSGGYLVSTLKFA